MDFQKLVVDVLRTYPSENMEYADIFLEQINGVLEFRNEINGYGAYCHFTVKPGCRKLPSHLNNTYVPNNYFFLHMMGRKYELGFVLATKDGVIDHLEIYPNDGVSWDGIVRPYKFSKIPIA